MRKTHLPQFLDYLDFKGIKHRPGKGKYEVLQIRIAQRGGQKIWSTLHERESDDIFYTVSATSEGIVSRFYRQSRLEFLEHIVRGFTAGDGNKSDEELKHFRFAASKALAFPTSRDFDTK